MGGQNKNARKKQTAETLQVFLCILYIGQAGGRAEPRQSSTFGQEACPLGAMLTLEGGAPVTSAHFLEPGLWGMTLPQIAAHPFGGAGVVTHPTALCSSAWGMAPQVEDHDSRGGRAPGGAIANFFIRFSDSSARFGTQQNDFQKNRAKQSNNRKNTREVGVARATPGVHRGYANGSEQPIAYTFCTSDSLKLERTEYASIPRRLPCRHAGSAWYQIVSP